MSKVRNRGMLAALLLSLFLSPGSARAQESPLTARERMMLDKIERLEERLDDLEKVEAARNAVQSVQVEQQQAAFENRMEEIEENVKQDPHATDFRVYWKDSLRMETGDKRFKLRIGGRTHLDWLWLNQSDDLKLFAEVDDGVEFRRARLYLSGEVYDDFFFKFQYDFAGGDADFKDVYLGMRNLPLVGSVKIGQMKEPFSLEEIASSNDITFMERALPNALALSRNTGIMLQNTALNDRLNASLGLFRDVDAYGNASNDGGYNLTGRLTGLPWCEEKGRKLLHLGASFSLRNPKETIRYRAYPEAHLASRFIDTGEFYAEDIDLLGLEAALVYGPFSMQGEYMQSEVDATYRGNCDLDGYYLQAGYFLTGEHRRYCMKSAKFKGPKVISPFSITGQRGAGAWELALRYSDLDLNDSFIFRGGQEENFTLALNWYLNSAARVLFNYIHADIEHDLYAGSMDIFQTRFQFAF